jgi:preprotein translocase subunit SecE
VARNRKRAKERRARRPQPVASTRGGAAEAPEPIAHATPDVELAEAQLAAGRPEEPEPDEGPNEEEFELEVEDSIGGGDGGRGRDTGFGGGAGDGGFGGGSGGGEIALPAPAQPVPRVGTVPRLIGFLQGSWRELQRVQWPDRRQVVQATGVVIGFVIVAGVYLGLADYVAQKFMKFILG